MKTLRISLILFGMLIFGIGLTNVPMLVKSVIAGSCQCPEGCPCSHCVGKSGGSCNCKR
ncbi:MAG: hypothetical protein QY310_11020 [Candidatus Jettenia sp. CY-1]|nr:MAG: hypothetical protein QY310_11020 [Candidatus Jettenia sp. CY-1]